MSTLSIGRTRRSSPSKGGNSSSSAAPHAAWLRFFDKHLEGMGTRRGHHAPHASFAAVPSVTKASLGAGGAVERMGSFLLRDPASSATTIVGRGSSGHNSTGGTVFIAGHRAKPRRAKSARSLKSAYSSQRSGSGGGAGGAGGKHAKQQQPVTEVEYEETIKRLRKLVLVEGVPSDELKLPKGHGETTTARALVWKLLLDVREVYPAQYLTYVARGPSPMHDKIRNDAFRTLATDKEFQERVDEAALIRMLDAFVWKHSRDSEERHTGVPNSHSDVTGAVPSFRIEEEYTSLEFSYVQGMNVLAAPFLYVMPSELEAFECFSCFIEKCCPTYVQPTLPGVHRGLELLGHCLQVADAPLSKRLHDTGLDAELFAFPSVLTLCACTPPLKQVLQLWDYLLAFGTHLAIPCVVAQLLMMREELMNVSQPMRLLRNLPELDAQSIVGIATTLVRDFDEQLYDDLVHHTLEL